QLVRAHQTHYGRVHGSPYSPFQDRHRGFPGARRAGIYAYRGAARRDRMSCRLRWRHATVPRALPRSVLCEPAGNFGDDRRRHDRRCGGRARQSRPGHGRRRPMSQNELSPTTLDELQQIIDRYPEPRSALLPMLHLLQSVQGAVTTEGIETCAEMLDLTPAEVSGVSTFYTMYKRNRVGKHLVGVCTNT